MLFYVPDIEEYRRSPGLNVDPLEEYPQLSFKDADSLASAVASDIRTDGSKVRPFDECAKAYLGDLRRGCTKRIVAEVASALVLARRRSGMMMGCAGDAVGKRLAAERKD